MNDILLHTFNQVESIAENLRLEMDRDQDLLEVMEKANSALSRISERIMAYDCRNQSAELPTFASVGEEGDTVNRTLQAVAHEIRNPLTAVGGFAKRLASSLDPASKSGRYAQVIVDEAIRLEEALSEMTGMTGHTES
jgi:nitrogen-specific signal transduction histidine kinase